MSLAFAGPKRGGLDATLKFVADTVNVYSPLGTTAALSKWELATKSPCVMQGRLFSCSWMEKPFQEIEDIHLFVEPSSGRVRLQLMFAPFTASRKDQDKVTRALPGAASAEARCGPKTGGTQCRVALPCGEYLIDFDREGRLGMIERSCAAGRGRAEEANIPTKDGGKACLVGEDCESVCLQNNTCYGFTRYQGCAFFKGHVGIICKD